MCLDIMEDYLGDGSSRNKRQKLDVVSSSSCVPIPPVVMAVQDDKDQSSKRKRGRPTKHEPTKEVAVHVKDKKKDERKDEMIEVSTSTSRNRQQSKHTVGTAEVMVVGEIEPTLTQLIGQFQDEYEEMGKRYAAMGKLLDQMKTAIVLRREKSEQQIRNEVLEEVQKSIFSSLPKK